MMANATVVLPQPDSPTRPTHSPCCRDSETSTTAGMSPSRVLYETCKPSIVRRGVFIMRGVIPTSYHTSPNSIIALHSRSIRRPVEQHGVILEPFDEPKTRAHCDLCLPIRA